ncbi:MAG: hypothetical protein WC969_01945 [Elusimicrobiota bacterium]|jgi:hypothetical protein
MKPPSAALLVFLFALPAARVVRAQPAVSSSPEYAGSLSSALLEDAELPPAPEGLDAWRANARDLSQGRLSTVPREAYESRILSFCSTLGLGDERAGRLLLHLRDRVQGQAWKPEDDAQRIRRLGAKDHKTVSGSLDAHAAALGVAHFEAAPEGGVVAADSVLALRVLRANLPFGRAPPKTALPDAASADAPVPWSEVEKVLKFGHRPYLPGRTGDMLDAAIRELRSPQGPAAVAEEVTRRSLEKMQQTPEGREVLRQLIGEFGSQGKTILVRSEKFEGSTIDRSNGYEGVVGIRGMAYTEDLIYGFNELYLKMKDREAVVDFLAGNMAHEFRHLANRAMVKRLSPDSLEDGFELSFVDEQRARQTGYLVAARLSKDKANDHTQEAASLGQDSAAFWDDLKTTGYPRYLDLEEMKDPVKAYRARLKALEEEKQETYLPLVRFKIPRLLSALDVMTKKEGLGPEGDTVRNDARVLAATIPNDLKDLETAMRDIQGLLKQMEDPALAQALARTREAGDSKAFLRLKADLARDQKNLEDLLRVKKMPAPKPPAGQLTRDQFWARVKTSVKEHPQYWTGFLKKFKLPEEK